MKTKILFLVIALIVIIFSSCESKSGRRARERQKVETLKSDTIVFCPEKIGVTELLTEFIPYPNYDGGTGIRVKFSLGIEYKGKIYEIDMKGSHFFSENVTEEKAKNDPGISRLIWVHYLISNTPKERIDVVVAKGEVIKLTKRSTFIANKYYSTELIWEKK